LDLPPAKPCAIFNANFSAGTFFNGLKRVRKGGHFEFRKNRQAVLMYPDSIVMEIVRLGSCGSGQSRARSGTLSGLRLRLSLQTLSTLP